MSQPISVCTIYKAANGDQKAFDWLVNAVVYNTKFGSFSLCPCVHKPPCAEPPQQKLLDLDHEIYHAAQERLQKEKKE